MATVKKPKILVDACRGDHYVRCWRENRRWVVQVWKGDKADGDPAGDWEMPGQFPMEAAIAQAVLQTK